MPRTDIYINRKSHHSLMSDAVYNDLKGKKDLLEKAYNIILKHLCKKKNIDRTYDYFTAIEQELRQYRDLLCLSKLAAPSTPAPSVANICDDPMFEDRKLRQLVNTMYNNAFLNKACLYKDKDGDYLVDVHIGGSYKYSQQYININKILQEKLPSLYDQSFVCVQFENKMACANIKSEDERKCNFCEKWTMERNMFRNAVNDIINSSDLNKAIELMTASIHLLPSAILDQKQYNKFFLAIEEFKKRYGKSIKH